MHLPHNDLRIGLDHPEGDISFLSHAHSDHTAGLRRKEKLIASQETLDLAKINAQVTGLPGTKTMDAGHILGSRQLFVEHDGASAVYTGDFSLKPNIFGWSAKIPQCDHLIMEATYGDPNYRFAPLSDIYDQIANWVKLNDKKNIIIGCYELGKAQQVIKILNENKIAPIVQEKTEHFCSVYEKYGYPLDRIMVGSDEAEEQMSRPFVAIVPMHRAKRYFAKRLSDAFDRETLCAVTTGWAMQWRYDADAAFPLSDHADFDDLVYFVEQSGAKKVEFFCGDGREVLKKTKHPLILATS
ncbi:hypothetical protein HY988_05570 [Candidatus Micrarchaeota archaeon]|nr:hypothetical protein [Candidatus Micrarchaeota archaeon]